MMLYVQTILVTFKDNLTFIMWLKLSDSFTTNFQNSGVSACLFLGVCCPHTLVVNTPPLIASNILQPPPEPSVVIPDIRPADISAAANIATTNFKQQEMKAELLFNQNIFAQ